MSAVKMKVSWRRLIRDAVVVVGSVYLAIVLEGMSETRGRRADAEQALLRLQTELQQDRADLDVVMAAQADRHVRHQRIDGWLGGPDAIPADSMTEDLTALFSVNRTMFPRNSSWTTMVASGQLTYLDDPALVARLANFYENLNERLEYNGVVYDEWVADVARRSAPHVWDRVDGRLLTTERAAIARFRGELLGLLDLSMGFYGLLEEWKAELEEVIEEVDRHHGIAGTGLSP